jgi:hypothetical protein
LPAVQPATPGLPCEVDWGLISEQGLETLRTIALPIALGLSYKEVAEQRGVTPYFVSKALDQLAEEIRRSL